MAARLLRPKRLLTLLLLAAALAAGAWWLVTIPYDPLAIYRPIPASATAVGRHVRLPARWTELLANPLALALMRTAGIRTEDAAELTTDGESRAWFEKLAGREGTLAYLPGRFGGAPAWMAVSHLGGESQKLRWQLALFRVPGFERLRNFPGRSVWRVETPDLDPGQVLTIAFGEGVLMACLSESPLAIAEVLAAYDGNLRRLLDEEPDFNTFARGDDRTVPDRFWARIPEASGTPGGAGVTVDVPVLRGDAVSLRAATDAAFGASEARARRGLFLDQGVAVFHLPAAGFESSGSLSASLSASSESCFGCTRTSTLTSLSIAFSVSAAIVFISKSCAHC